MENNYIDYAKIDYLISHLIRTLGKETQEIFEEKITVPQFIVLQTIAREKKCNLKDIASELGNTTGAASLLVDKMTKLGYIVRERDDNDRRLIWLTFSENGAKLYNQITEKRNQALEKYFQKLTPKENELFMELLDKCIGEETK
jgi:MarR family transcriptional regulator, organic hydroperoxide resistance regulator